MTTIILLAADCADADRCSANLPDDVTVVVVLGPNTVPAQVEPGTRVHVTDRCAPRAGVISALQQLAARVPLVDPTGLLGPVDRREGARTTAPAHKPVTGAAQAAVRRTRHDAKGAYQ